MEKLFQPQQDINNTSNSERKLSPEKNSLEARTKIVEDFNFIE